MLGVNENGHYEVKNTPLKAIHEEDEAIDEKHAQKLKNLIQQASDGESSGQLVPVLLAHTPEAERLYIVDGFHRVRVLGELGQTAIRATIIPNATADEINDLRIIATGSHESVKFPRMSGWAKDAWRLTPWADKLSPIQAVRLVVRNSNGERYGSVTPDEVAEIKRWVIEKSEQWQVAPKTIWSYLRTSAAADPQLVKQTRQQRGNRTEPAFTQAHLQKIATELPDYKKF